MQWIDEYDLFSVESVYTVMNLDKVKLNLAKLTDGCLSGSKTGNKFTLQLGDCKKQKFENVICKMGGIFGAYCPNRWQD